MTILYNFQSHNYNDRAFGCLIQYIVIHYTAMESSEHALKWLCSHESSVSSHYLIDENGRIFSLVSEKKRAWHAGTPTYWKGQDDINSRSIGIELSNLGTHPFSLKQIKALLYLIKDIQNRHKMNPQDILGHADVAVSRKIDPGPFFPWKHLASQGFGLWVSRKNLKKKIKSPLEVQKKLQEFGYQCSLSEVWDRETHDVIRAFLLRFYPELWIKKGQFLKTDVDGFTQISGVIDDLLTRLIGQSKLLK
ncbi:MAG: N-acetylmuramoyl-L-alanine amidase [Proteobacteria bacterium]|nr:N-acetylmuramoyl-L-alanine amidase [Pseudomonadota bacterium]